MHDQTFLEKVFDFFKAIGRREASGEPIDIGRGKPDEEFEDKQIDLTADLHHDESVEPVTNEKADRLELARAQKVPLKTELKAEPKAKSAAKTRVRKVPKAAPGLLTRSTTPEQTQNALAQAGLEGSYPPVVAELIARYVWKDLKSKTPLPVPVVNEPFNFVGPDKNPVAANRAEISFVKELLKKAAEAGLESKFAFSLLPSMELVVKYRNRLVGRVFLHGRSHHMVFRIDRKAIRVDDLSLTECKKLTVVWIAQIKDSLQAKA